MARQKASGFQAWLHNGRLSTVAMAIVFGTYIGFRIAHIQAPELDNALTYMLGIWVVNLGLAQVRATADRTDQIEEKTGQIEQRVEKLRNVAVEQHPEIAGDLDES